MSGGVGGSPMLVAMMLAAIGVLAGCGEAFVAPVAPASSVDSVSPVSEPKTQQLPPPQHSTPAEASTEPFIMTSTEAESDYRCDPIQSAAEAAAVSGSIRYINVNVATLWKSPVSPRPLDEPSLRAPADLPAWLDHQSIRDKLALVGKTETEVLLGEPVELIEERGEWARVAVPSQHTPLHSKGYPGWLPKKQLADRSAVLAYAGCNLAVVSKRTSSLFEDASLQKPVLQVSFGTRLYVADARGAAIQVATPVDGLRWVARSDVMLHDARTKEAQPTGEAIVTYGKQFLGLPYLWAGTSGFGFDCSGFTYSLYRYYGIELPRDAKDQAMAGLAVDRRHLQPGDLLFFAYEKGKGAIHHVAMYAGDGMILHSPKTERAVELIPLDTPEYVTELAAARRMIQD